MGLQTHTTYTMTHKQKSDALAKAAKSVLETHNGRHAFKNEITLMRIEKLESALADYEAAQEPEPVGIFVLPAEVEAALEFFKCASSNFRGWSNAASGPDGAIFNSDRKNYLAEMDANAGLLSRWANRVIEKAKQPTEQPGEARADWMRIEQRLMSYFGNGGLFNPEMMEHDKVRQLLSDIQDLLRSGHAPKLSAPNEVSAKELISYLVENEEFGLCDEVMLTIKLIEKERATREARP